MRDTKITVGLKLPRMAHPNRQQFDAACSSHTARPYPCSLLVFVCWAGFVFCRPGYCNCARGVGLHDVDTRTRPAD